MNIIKMALISLAAVTVSFAAPTWTSPANVEQVWVSPGPTPVAYVKLIGVSTAFIFHVNQTGYQELLVLAQEAITNNLKLKIYGEPGVYTTLYTGLSSPNIATVGGFPLYSIAMVP